MVYRVYVEKKPGLRHEATGLMGELRSLLGGREYTVDLQGCLCDGARVVDGDVLILQQLVSFLQLLLKTGDFLAVLNEHFQKLNSGQFSQLLICHNIYLRFKVLG